MLHSKKIDNAYWQSWSSWPSVCCWLAVCRRKRDPTATTQTDRKMLLLLRTYYYCCRRICRTCNSCNRSCCFCCCCWYWLQHKQTDSQPARFLWLKHKIVVSFACVADADDNSNNNNNTTKGSNNSLNLPRMHLGIQCCGIFKRACLYLHFNCAFVCLLPLLKCCCCFTSPESNQYVAPCVACGCLKQL